MNSIKLPDLNQYKAAFQQSGVALPLPVIEGSGTGLLTRLPPASHGKTGWPWTEQVDPTRYSGKTDWPRLSIVTPSYNQGGFLEETIRAVLLQNYPNLEFIIMDGGSSDETLTVIKKYEPWISYYRSERDRGQGHAINLGFSLASGDYYAWINSDDYYLQGTLLSVIRTFLKTRASFVYGYSLDYIVEKQQFNPVNKVLPFIDYLIRFPSLAQPACFWSAEIHQPIWEELHCSLDYELWLRMVKGKKRTLIKGPLAVANIHFDAKTADPKMKQKWHEDHLRICDPDAHGPVLNWDRLAIVNRIRNKLYKWFSR